MEKIFDYSNSEIYRKLLPEVEHIVINEMKLPVETINEDDIKQITQRICEERPEDSLDFLVYLSEVESMSNDEDWSDVNGCICNMIEKHLKEKESNLVH